MTATDCIYTPLPTLPPSYMSRTVPLQVLKKMSKLEDDLRVRNEYYQSLFYLSHSNVDSDKEKLFQEMNGVDRCAVINSTNNTIPFTSMKNVSTPEVTHPNNNTSSVGDITAADIVERIQEEVLLRFGFQKDDVFALYELRTAAMQYPLEDDFQETVYFKYNRSGDVAEIVEGLMGPNCSLVIPPTSPGDTLLVETTLHDILAQVEEDMPIVEDITPSNNISLLPNDQLEKMEKVVPLQRLEKKFRHYPRVVVSGSYT